MSTVPNEVDQIRRQMAEIRRVLHADVQGVVATAEAATDWHRYLSAYPWVTLGVSFAVGYLIVPRRHKSVATRADLTQVREAIENTREKVVEVAKKTRDDPGTRKKGLIAAALGIVTPLVLRAAQGYALKYLEQWIQEQQVQHTQTGPPPIPSGPSGGPGPGPVHPGRPRPGFGTGRA